MNNTNFLKNFKAGLQFSPKDDRNLLFSTFVIDNLPVLPVCDNLSTIFQKLKITPNISYLAPMDFNDQYGCCVFASLAHSCTIFKALAGQLYIPPADEVLKNYLEFTGGQDTGCNMLEVMKRWQKTKWFNDEDIAFVTIDIKNHNHIKQAIELFGGIFLCVNLQETAEEDFQNNKTWEPGKLTGHGHAVYAAGYDENYLQILSWGDMIQSSWAWLDCCAIEAWGVISLETDKFDNKFDINKLKNYLKIVGNTSMIVDTTIITGGTQTII